MTPMLLVIFFASKSVSRIFWRSYITCMPPNLVQGVIPSNIRRKIISRLSPRIILLVPHELSARPLSSRQLNKRWSSSSSRWRDRQNRDPLAREAKVQGLKSRAAFKLLEVESTFPCTALADF